MLGWLLRGILVKKYTILRKLDDGQNLPIVKFDHFDEARKLLESLYEYWPAEYFIRGPQGDIEQNVPAPTQ